MRTLNRWLLTVLAAGCVGCLPTITIKNKNNDCAYAGISKPSFEVPLDEDFAVWRIDNQCDKEVKAVEVKDFYIKKDDKCYPAMKACQIMPTPAHSESVITCEVNPDCRRPEPYKYSIYLGTTLAEDPQVVIKKDGVFVSSACPPITCIGPH